MRNLFLAAGVAALAISVPAAGEPRGKGGDKRAQAAKAERGGERARGARAERRVERARGARAERRSDRRVDRSRNARAEQRAERRSERAQSARAERVRDRRAERVRGNREDRTERARAERTRDNRADRVRQARAEQLRDRRAQNARQARAEQLRDRRTQSVRQARAEQLRDRRQDRLRAERVRDRRDDLRDRRARLARARDFDRDRFDRRFERRGMPAAFVNGCPPGLAKQNALCMPPGQYKKLVGQRVPTAYRAQAIPRQLRDYYRDTDDYYYRYGGGYAYRVDRDEQLVRAVLPLIGAGLGIGMPFPYSSPSYHVPSSYQPFYPDSRHSYYRYAGGYVYEIDRGSGLIDDMIPLLDHGYGVGQMMPASYSYYNVPDPYRSWYQDDDDYYYRYAPGAIYQVDRESRLITAIVSLLTGNGNGLAVGQPLPMGYDMYNVPYAYRDRYYDTDDSWYRYSNGRIYEVDPTTRLITAIVSAIV